MKFLSRDNILNASDIEFEDVEVPEWGGTVRVRELTTAEVENFSLRTSDARGQLDISRMSGLRAEVVSWALIDEEGKQLLNKRDAEQLQMKSHRVIDRLFNKVLVMSGLQDQVAEGEGSEPEKKA